MGISSFQAKELADFISKCENSPDGVAKAGAGKLAAAKLKVACWVLKSQGIKPTLDNIASILGPDFKDALGVMREVKEELGEDGPILKF